jgi:hypothetical protein
MIDHFITYTPDGALLRVMLTKCDMYINGFPWRQYPKEHRDAVEAKAKELQIEIHY